MAERFAAVDVADVDFNHGCGDGCHGIGDSDRRMGIAACVEDNAALVEAHRLQAVHDFALDVALIDVDGVLRELLNEFLQVLVEGAVAIDLGLAPAHKVQVGTVDDVDNHYFLK